MRAFLLSILARPLRLLMLALVVSIYFLPGLWLVSWHLTHPRGAAIAGTRVLPDWRWSVLPRIVNPGADGKALAELSSGCCLTLFGSENAGVVEVIGQLPKSAYSTIEAIERHDSRILTLQGSNGESFCAFSPNVASALCTFNRGDHLDRVVMRGKAEDLDFFTRIARTIAGDSGSGPSN